MIFIANQDTIKSAERIAFPSVAYFTAFWDSCQRKKAPAF